MPEEGLTEKELEAEDDAEVKIGRDLDGDGKPDVWAVFKGKKAVSIAGAIIAVVIGLTKLFGLW